MNILAVDASTNVASCAVLSEQKLVAEETVNYSLKHSEKLMPAICSVMEDAHLDYSQLDYVAVTKGPGSFTGLRIGMAAVKGICQAADKPVIGVSTLEALAYNILYTQGVICPILDARRSQVYTALFQTDGKGNLERLTEDMALSMDELIDRLKEHKSFYLLGDGCPIYAEKILSTLPQGILIAPYQQMGQAASVAYCAFSHKDQAQDFHYLEPSYLRASYAEEKKQ